MSAISRQEKILVTETCNASKPDFALFVKNLSKNAFFMVFLDIFCLYPRY